MENLSTGDKDAFVTDLSSREKTLRNEFVREYLVDYDSYKACLRVGFAPAYAKIFCHSFMSETYTLQKIREAQTAPTDELDELSEKKKIVAAMWREANYQGTGGSAAARVAALAKLSAFYGMDAPKRTSTELTGPDGQPLNAGVFVVPGLMTTEDWEEQAAVHQEQLTKPEQIIPDLKLAS